MLDVLSILFKAFTYFFMFVSFAFIISIFLTLSITGIGMYPFKTFLFNANWNQVFINSIFIILILAPIFTLIYWIIKSAAKNKNQLKPIGIIISAFWYIAMLGVFIMMGSLFMDLKSRETRVDSYPIEVKGETLYVKYKKTGNFISDYNLGVENLMHADGNKLFVKTVFIKTQTSKDNNWHVNILRKANGSNISEAQNRANNIFFDYSQQGDTLYVNPELYIEKPALYRAQSVTVQIEVPENKEVVQDDYNMHFGAWYNEDN